MIEVVENPSFKPRDFDRSSKKPGISAIIRLRNEEDYLELAINSILPFFDEVVIVYNGCTDRTPEIVERFAAQEPKRVKAFHYLPEVFPPESDRHRRLPPDHVSSLAHYYNFALSQTTRRICAKWDGDMIAAPEPLGRIVDRLRGLKFPAPAWWLSPWQRGYWWYSGVNLCDRGGEIFVVKAKPRVSGRWDHGLWPIRRRNIFAHRPRFEVLRTGGLVKQFVGFVFFHVKGMKRDRGLRIDQLDKNPRSRHINAAEKFWLNPEVISFEEYCQIEPGARSLPDPRSLGIRPVRDD